MSEIFLPIHEKLLLPVMLCFTAISSLLKLLSITQPFKYLKYSSEILQSSVYFARNAGLHSLKGKLNPQLKILFSKVAIENIFCIGLLAVYVLIIDTIISGNYPNSLLLEKKSMKFIQNS